jgi:hypothetical protein
VLARLPFWAPSSWTHAHRPAGHAPHARAESAPLATGEQGCVPAGVAHSRASYQRLRRRVVGAVPRPEGRVASRAGGDDLVVAGRGGGRTRTHTA